MLIPLTKPTVTLKKLICLVLMLAVGFAGIRLLLNDLVTPAHLHVPVSVAGQITALTTSTDMHEHQHTSVHRHIHETSFRSFQMVVTSDHETGDDFSAEKSASKVCFDCDLTGLFHRSEVSSKATFGINTFDALTSTVRPRLDRPPISI
jgi:hypothetical protein